MADPLTTAQPPLDAPEGPPRPFDRRALEATLADVVRTAEPAASPDSHSETPAAAPAARALPDSLVAAPIDEVNGLQASPAGGASSAADETVPGNSTSTVDETAGNSTSTVDETAGNSTSAADETFPGNSTSAADETAGNSTSPGRLSVDALQPSAARPRSVNPFGRPQASVDDKPGGARPVPSLLGGGSNRIDRGLLQSPSGGSLGGLRPGGSAALGSQNFGSTSSGLSGGLNGGRSASGFSLTPLERPTIPLRRPKPADPDKPSDPTAPPSEPTSAGAAPAPSTSLPSAPIEAWYPTDDDILPQGEVKRRPFAFIRR